MNLFGKGVLLDIFLNVGLGGRLFSVGKIVDLCRVSHSLFLPFVETPTREKKTFEKNLKFFHKILNSTKQMQSKDRPKAYFLSEN